MGAVRVLYGRVHSAELHECFLLVFTQRCYKSALWLRGLYVFVTSHDTGWCVSAGNSLSALLDGSARLTFLARGEDYVITMPYAHCKGTSTIFASN